MILALFYITFTLIAGILLAGQSIHAAGRARRDDRRQVR